VIRRRRPASPSFAGFGFAPEVILLAVRWYLRYGLSYRDVDELLPDVVHDPTQYANNKIECDHGRLKARLHPMRGLRTDRTASTVIRWHALVQSLRRGHYELGVDARRECLRLAAALDELAEAI
jgi:transposase-like protein